MPISILVKKKFYDLSMELSPETLTCDGELPHDLAQKRYRALIAKWHLLEKHVGRKVTETEVFNWFHDPSTMEPREPTDQD